MLVRSRLLSLAFIESNGFSIRYQLIEAIAIVTAADAIVADKIECRPIGVL